IPNLDLKFRPHASAHAPALLSTDNATGRPALIGGISILSFNKAISLSSPIPFADSRLLTVHLNYLREQIRLIAIYAPTQFYERRIWWTTTLVPALENPTGASATMLAGDFNSVILPIDRNRPLKDYECREGASFAKLMDTHALVDTFNELFPSATDIFSFYGRQRLNSVTPPTLSRLDRIYISRVFLPRLAASPYMQTRTTITDHMYAPLFSLGFTNPTVAPRPWRLRQHLLMRLRAAQIIYASLAAFPSSPSPDSWDGWKLDLTLNIKRFSNLERCRRSPLPSRNRESTPLSHTKKTPGPDSLLGELFRQFSPRFAPAFHSLLSPPQPLSSLPPSMLTGRTVLIPKRGDSSLEENLCPNTLMNADYKVLALCLANRLQLILPQLIHPSQTAFIKHRKIGDTINDNLDIMDWAAFSSSPLPALTVDFRKAYDFVDSCGQQKLPSVSLARAAALLAIKVAMGLTFTTWATSNPCHLEGDAGSAGEWSGLSCAADGCVFMMWMPWNFLDGSLASYLRNFSALTNLNTIAMQHMYLSGSLPSLLTTLPSLIGISFLPPRLYDAPHLSSCLFSLPSSIPPFFALMRPSAVALLAIKDAMRVTFTTWATSNPCQLEGATAKEGEWSSISCTEDGRVFMINLDCAGLVHKSFPTDISKLMGLGVVWMPWNFLDGSLASYLRDFSALTNLNTLAMQYMYFSGSLPSVLTTLPKLIGMSLRFNYLTGSLPAAITKIKSLDLY
ncbi:unnamed protein product, partial [Closterium sp. NIES-65]